MVSIGRDGSVPGMKRRTYYDHEPAYRQIAAKGGRGWDDLHPGEWHGSYTALEGFLDDPLCPAAGGPALELGCGGGQASLRLVARGFTVTGIDFAETAIALARQNAAEAGAEATATFLVGDCLALPFGEGAFELVVDNHLLHCIVGAEDRARVLAEVARVLRPGGRLFGESMSAEGEVDWAHYGIDPFSRVTTPGNRYFVHEAELREELEAAGLVVRLLRRRPADDSPPAGDTISYVAERPRG